MSKAYRLALSILTAFAFSPVYAAIPSDGEISEVMEEANEATIKAAKLAEKKAASETVRSFAKMMTDVHKQNEKDEKKMSKEAKIKSKSSDMSKSFKKDAKEKLSSLKSLKGEAFDKAYINTEIEMHQKLLTDLEANYIPNAQNPELRSYLEKTKTHTEEHLNQAKKIQESLSGQMQQ